MAEICQQNTKNTKADKFGWGETEDANERTQELCDKVKEEVQRQTRGDNTEYKAVKYRQLRGILGAEHFLIKVQVGDTNYIHLYVVKIVGPNASPTLEGVQQNKTRDDTIEPIPASPPQTVTVLQAIVS
ncbi:cystatin-A-like [Plectropomus leopardus]|uniref:cystatin-A-like n=1 Tax=Plectropomus leopardus TaxID=160734 RepID=UPI001C4B2B83|nr:cystatin-A-like [Plectropomus leopardus]